MRVGLILPEESWRVIRKLRPRFLAAAQIRRDPTAAFCDRTDDVRCDDRIGEKDKKKEEKEQGETKRAGRRCANWPSRVCGRAAAAIVPKLLSASLDGAARRGTRFESKCPHRDNASRKWGRVIKPLYNRSSWAGEVSRRGVARHKQGACDSPSHYPLPSLPRDRER